MKWWLPHEPRPLPPGTKYEEVLTRVYNEAWVAASQDLMLWGECGVEIDGSGEDVVVRRVPVEELKATKARNPTGVIWYRLEKRE